MQIFPQSISVWTDKQTHHFKLCFVIRWSVLDRDVNSLNWDKSQANGSFHSDIKKKKKKVGGGPLFDSLSISFGHNITLYTLSVWLGGPRTDEIAMFALTRLCKVTRTIAQVCVCVETRAPTPCKYHVHSTHCIHGNGEKRLTRYILPPRREGVRWLNSEDNRSTVKYESKPL